MTDSRKLSGFTPASASRAIRGTRASALKEPLARPGSRHPRTRHDIHVWLALGLCTVTWAACSSTGEAETGTPGSTSADSSGVSGSGGGGGATSSGSEGGGGDPDCGASPSAAPSVLTAECGVFVKEGGSDQTGDGTEANPFGTLGHAIDVAKAGPMRVYACRGMYLEAVTVPPGLSLYGGLSCEAPEWAPGAVGDRSAVQGKEGQIPLRLQGGDNAAEIVLEGFSVTAAAGGAPGQSSIAAIAEDKAIAKLTSVELTAGDAAPGAAGENAPKDAPVTVKPDPAKQYGINACMNLVQNDGGEQLDNDCGGGEISIGGAGGNGTQPAGQSGQNGLPDLMVAGAGVGGVGGAACGGVNGGIGSNGADGPGGVPGSPGVGAGTLSAVQGWTGASGADGAKGQVGQGGGGGAGQKGKLGCAGASGGAGGAGGCGGMGGKGGQAGGSSIALVSINATLTLTGVTLVVGKAGNGGKGGNAQSGGTGSMGSPGGMGSSGAPGGCYGGNGGKGGNGGTGGGGAGGHAIGIAHIGAAPAGAAFMSIPSSGGLGGPGGNNGFQKNNGDSGEAGETLEFAAP